MNALSGTLDFFYNESEFPLFKGWRIAYA